MYCAFAEGTLEQTVTAVAVRRTASMEAMASEDTALLEAIVNVIEQAATSEVEAAVLV